MDQYATEPASNKDRCAGGVGMPDPIRNRKPSNSLDYQVVITSLLVSDARVSIEVHSTSVNPMWTCINSVDERVEYTEY